MVSIPKGKIKDDWVIRENAIDGNPGVGILVGDDSHDIRIENDNQITNNGYGVYVSESVYGTLQKTIVKENNIVGNTFGVTDGSDVRLETLSRRTVDGSSAPPTGIRSGVEVEAVCNWWGDIFDPTHSSNPCGNGDSVSDNVLYTPWQNDTYPDGDCV